MKKQEAAPGRRGRPKRIDSSERTQVRVESHKIKKLILLTGKCDGAAAVRCAIDRFLSAQAQAAT